MSAFSLSLNSIFPNVFIEYNLISFFVLPECAGKDFLFFLIGSFQSWTIWAGFYPCLFFNEDFLSNM